MAFNSANLVLARAFPLGAYGFSYSTADTVATIEGGSNYFTGLAAMEKLRVGDLIAVAASDGKFLAAVLSKNAVSNPYVQFLNLAAVSAFEDFAG